jgi:hypothetical protein
MQEACNSVGSAPVEANPPQSKNLPYHRDAGLTRICEVHRWGHDAVVDIAGSTPMNAMPFVVPCSKDTHLMDQYVTAM